MKKGSLEGRGGGGGGGERALQPILEALKMAKRSPP